MPEPEPESELDSEPEPESAAQSEPGFMATFGEPDQISEGNYGQSVTPDNWTLYKVFTRKTIRVSWTRRRLQQAVIWPTVLAVIHLAFWLFFEWLLDLELETDDGNMPQIKQVRRGPDPSCHLLNPRPRRRTPFILNTTSQIERVPEN
jgi:hypothetical protein